MERPARWAEDGGIVIDVGIRAKGFEVGGCEADTLFKIWQNVFKCPTLVANLVGPFLV